jgi:hypothetical protein
MAGREKDKQTLRGMLAKGQDLERILSSFPELEDAAREIQPAFFGLPVDVTPEPDNRRDFQSSIAENLAKYRAQQGGSGAAFARIGDRDEVIG